MSSTSAFADSTTTPATRRRRAQIACRNCRRRKIKASFTPCAGLSFADGTSFTRKGLVCEYVAVGDPSPPSTPLSDRDMYTATFHLEGQPYAYGSNSISRFPDPPYSAGYPNQMSGGYPGYPGTSSLNNQTHPISRFPSGPPTAWPSSSANSPMLANQTRPMSDRPYYAPDFSSSSHRNSPQWAQIQDPMRPRIPDAYDSTRLQYYAHMPESNLQHAGPYGTQSYDSNHPCWCREATCICGGRR
ncbi:hypothetical protein BT96DRAFT_931150 [Gymnopus androsaceus JB14]|uniref:Uncharacterized protein n=1 Tax=Gymnopus androsaceus JB14 TaxID=1447944 RepID=A0A6A4IKC7_9AGAR|nr:hypothetical protein BT96DRAFT_931150 [Gymnopus androsaceus JB14]